MIRRTPVASLASAALAAAACSSFACFSFARAADAPVRGAVVRRVFAGGRGDIARLKEGDVVSRCDGEPVGSPEDLRRVLLAAREKLTVKIDVFRKDKGIELDIIPGPPDVYCEEFFRGYQAFLAGPNASPERNEHVRGGYEAFEKKQWREAAEHFEKAVAGDLPGEAVVPDGDVLRHLARASIASLEGEKAHRYASALLALDGEDSGSVMLLYLSCMMSDRYGEAARLVGRLPPVRGRVEFRPKPEVDAGALERAEAAKTAYLASGGDLTKAIDPLEGKRVVERGLRCSDSELRKEIFAAYINNSRSRGGVERVRDFVFTFTVLADFLTWDSDARPVMAEVRNVDNEALFNVGVDQWGRLLLGHVWYETVGLSDAVRPAPEKNAVTLKRKGARLDAFVNGRFVARTFVAPKQRLKLYVCYMNGSFEFEGVSVATPQAGVPHF